MLTVGALFALDSAVLGGLATLLAVAGGVALVAALPLLVVSALDA